MTIAVDWDIKDQFKQTNHLVDTVEPDHKLENENNCFLYGQEHNGASWSIGYGIFIIQRQSIYMSFKFDIYLQAIKIQDVSIVHLSALFLC